jgi:hypothetical protein
MATGLVDVDNLFRRKFGMDESRSDVSLSRVKVEHCGENHHESDSGPLDNRRPCFEVINAFNLTITASTEASLELLDSAIRESLAFECPGRWEDVHLGGP